MKLKILHLCILSSFVLGLLFGFSCIFGMQDKKIQDAAWCIAYSSIARGYAQEEWPSRFFPLQYRIIPYVASTKKIKSSNEIRQSSLVKEGPWRWTLLSKLLLLSGTVFVCHYLWQQLVHLKK